MTQVGTVTPVGSARFDGDTWDLASSVGLTATMVAAARAVASRAPDPLIDDQFAAPPLPAVGVDHFARMAGGELDPGELGSPRRAYSTSTSPIKKEQLRRRHAAPVRPVDPTRLRARYGGPCVFRRVFRRPHRCRDLPERPWLADRRPERHRLAGRTRVAADRRRRPVRRGYVRFGRTEIGAR
jgi:hypothetical protein